MISLFTPATEDASLTYLAQIFGSMSGIITTSSSYGNITLLSTMFKYFNGIILTVGALLVVYITVVSVMITAHEGEFMGKKYHQLWTPLRTVMGIALLIPTASGYSAIQFIMMWVIVQGVGAADQLWNTALNYVNAMGSPYAQLSTPTVGTNAALSAIWKGRACNATALHPDPLNLGKDIAPYYCASHSCSPISWTASLTEGSKPYYLGPVQGTNLCGMLYTCDGTAACADKSTGSKQLACDVCNVQLSNLATIFSILDPIARNLADTDYNYRDFYQNSATATTPNSNWNFVYSYCSANGISQADCCITPVGADLLGGEVTCHSNSSSSFYSPYQSKDFGSATPEAVAYIYWPYSIKLGGTSGGPGDFMSTITSAYSSAVNGAIADFLTTADNAGDSDVTSRLQEAAKTGWIFAGSYYYIISQMNNSNSSAAMPTLSVTAPGDGMKDYRNNNNASTVLANIAAGNPPSSTPGAEVAAPLANAGSDATKQLGVLGSSTSNPIAQMQQTGMALFAIVQITFVVLLVLVYIYGIAAFFNVFALGTGLIDPLFGGSILVSFFLVPAIIALFGIMISLGGLLGVYLPLIPYIIFTVGAIGWFLSTLEAMVAGPLVALGILSAGGQHEIMGKAEPALMLIFGIFLRPSLMIFGLMAAMLLATVVADMINTAFWSTVAAGIAGGGVGESAAYKGGGALFALNPLEGIIFLCAYVSLMLTAMNKCFSAIHILPERVLTWIGAPAMAGAGEGEAVGEMKGGVSAGTSKAGGVAGAAQAGVQQTKDYKDKKKTEMDRQAAADQDKVTPTGGSGGDTTPPPSSGG